MAQPTPPLGTGEAMTAANKAVAKNQYDALVQNAAEEGKTLPPFDDWYTQTTAKAGSNGLLAAGKK